jgi:hypothetical protein
VRRWTKASIENGGGFPLLAELMGKDIGQSFTSDQAKIRAFSKTDHSSMNRVNFLPVSLSDYEKYSVRAGLFNYFFGIYIWLIESWKCGYGPYFNASGV